ncbi:MAG: hypothetical protein M0Q13_01275 [Methanothrix sp.]|jgi:hypothetical protein|nr:hypothetical protein [Methanothrix sp.]
MHKFLKVTEQNNCKRGVTVNNRISICILLCLAIIASGQAAAQQTYGTKVNAGDPDVGLPLSAFSALVGVPAQLGAFISYWDIGTTPGFYDDKDVAYLQFGSVAAGPIRIVRANDIRLTGWGIYPAGTNVKPGDSDIGQMLIPNFPTPTLPSAGGIRFYYMDVSGGGYDMADPVYLKAISTAAPITETNDIRITANAGFPAGSRVSLNDPDAVKTLTPFMPLIAIPPAGGAFFASAIGPVARLAFFNANGNVIAPGSQPIYDEGDAVYFDVTPLNVVSPNDIRLY